MSDNFLKVARVSDIPAGQMLRVNVSGKKLLLANDNGNIYALDEMCSHEDYSLFLGCIRDGKIKCSLHGSWFDMSNGEPLEDPADEPIRTYPVRIHGEDILLDAECH